MKFPVLTAVLILIFIIAFCVRRGKDSYANEEAAFWARERKANSTRKKPLDDLKYITVSLERLPLTTLADDPGISDFISTIRDLSEEKIVNLTGLSNTDLKLKYGVGNLSHLMVCDQRFTLLVSTLQRWADALYKKGEKDAARLVLEYAVDIGTDASSTYKLLSSIYAESGENDRIAALIPKANALNSPMKNTILNYLSEANRDGSL